MKTYYTLLILLLSFSSLNAQDAAEKNEIESTVIAFENNEVASLIVDQVVAPVTINAALTSEATLVRTSDIRAYLNQVRNIENIDLLFPKINKTVKV